MMHHEHRLLAFDRSLRTKDVEGRLHIESCNISKATVNPYLGREIPEYQRLGLDADRVYMLLRDPDELAKAAPTFNNLPVLERHVYVSAQKPEADIVVGTTGSDVTFDGTYLKSSLAVWTQDGITLIESGQQRELSSAYRFRADMTPGRFKGVAYDGVMRDIIGNHVALVRRGRAGSDVMVADHNWTEDTAHMAKLTAKGAIIAAALRTALAPRLAQDADLDGSIAKVLSTVPKAAYALQAAGILAQVRTVFTPLLATDQQLDDIDSVLARLVGSGAGQIVAQDAESMTANPEDDDAEYEDDPDQPGKRRKRKVAQDKGNPLAPEKPEGGAEKPAMDTKDFVSKTDFDAAVAKVAQDSAANTQAAVAAAVAAERALHKAREEVEPLVGKVALDSAEAVYKFALEQAKVDLTGVEPSAFGALARMKVSQLVDAKRPRVAQDHAPISKPARELHPHLSRIRHA